MYSIHFTLMSGLVLPPTLGQFPSCSRLTLLCRGTNKVDIAELPYSGKLSREKTFADRWKIRFSRRKLSRIACFCHAKGHHAPKFRGENSRIATNRKIRESFPLYGINVTTACLLYVLLNSTTCCLYSLWSAVWFPQMVPGARDSDHPDWFIIVALPDDQMHY